MRARVKLSGNLERQLQQAARPKVRAIAAQYQRMLDRLGRQYAGKDIEQIKPALRAQWSRVNGGRITDPQLSVYAQHISEGTPIKVHTP